MCAGRRQRKGRPRLLKVACPDRQNVGGSPKVCPNCPMGTQGPTVCVWGVWVVRGSVVQLWALSVWEWHVESRPKGGWNGGRGMPVCMRGVCGSAAGGRPQGR